MRRCLFLSLILLAGSSARSDSEALLTADQIMNRLALNQDQANAVRRQYVYKQHIRVVSRKTNGKVMRDEAADYDVVPSEKGSSKKLTQLLGRFWNKDQYSTYTGEPAPENDSMDGEIVSELRDDLADEKRARDGLAVNLFPLTSKEQQQYRFRLMPDQTLNGHKVYRVRFDPKKKSDTAWCGEAFIDKTDFQPVMIFTKLSRKVPFVVRTALGTNLPGIGFSVTYKREPDGVWFPSTFGTEFRLKALFFINRDISVSLLNSDFEHTHVDSALHYAPVQ